MADPDFKEIIQGYGIVFPSNPSIGHMWIYVHNVCYVNIQYGGQNVLHDVQLAIYQLQDPFRQFDMYIPICVKPLYTVSYRVSYLINT
jgi:hypothetical protein